MIHSILANNLRAWQSFSTIYLQVFFGLPLGLARSTSYSIHFFTQSVSSFRSTCRVNTFKLLGIYVSRDLTWNNHVTYIYKRVNSRLHFLRQLKMAAVSCRHVKVLHCCHMPGYGICSTCMAHRCYRWIGRESRVISETHTQNNFWW